MLFQRPAGSDKNVVEHPGADRGLKAVVAVGPQALRSVGLVEVRNQAEESRLQIVDRDRRTIERIGDFGWRPRRERHSRIESKDLLVIGSAVPAEIKGNSARYLMLYAQVVLPLVFAVEAGVKINVIDLSETRIGIGPNVLVAKAVAGRDAANRCTV